MNRKTGGWFTVVIGVVLLIAGLVWGLAGSHRVSYQNSLQNVIYRIGVGTDSGNVYIHADGSSEYFVALSGDFSPAITQSDVDNSTGLSFVARTDTTSVDLDVDGTTVNDAHKIEKLVFYDNNGSTMATYTTTEYVANPTGVMVNAWSDAIWLVGLGLALAFFGIIGALRKMNTSFSIGNPGVPSYPPVPPTYPPVQPGTPYPPANPYGQGYQGAEQYPQPNPYDQPGSNPYQQPPLG